MKKLVYILAVAVLSGCATTAKYESKLQSLVGVTEERLYAAWGIPTKSMQLKDGSKLVEYYSSSHTQLGGYSYTVPQTIYESGTATITGKEGTEQVTYSGTTTTLVEKTDPVRNIHLNCKTMFTINPQGVVSSWKWSGNNCVSD